MKRIKKIAVLFLAIVMVMAMGMTAFAEETGDTGEIKKTTATITIENAAKGETYTVYRLFDAKVADGSTSIAYTGSIPAGLEDYFEIKAGNIYARDTAKDGDNMSEGLKTALQTWVNGATPAATPVVADGSAVVFRNLPFGYYIVRTTQGESALTVTSISPDANIFDKNSTEPSVPEDGKKVSVNGGTAADSVSASIGDTVTYTLKFATSNFEGSGADAKKITSYIVNDTLPHLTDISVTSVTIKDGVFKEDSTTEYKDVVLTGSAVQFNPATKKIVIPWVDDTADQNSLYRNNVNVEVVYTAKLADDAVIAGDGNVNTFKLTYTTEGDDEEKTPTQSTDTATVKTYALAIKKVDQAGQPLDGATFSVAGLQTVGSNGVYTVTGKTGGDDSDSVMDTNEDGILIIKGVAEGEYVVTEVAAPEGYNKLETTETIEATKTSETESTTTIYLDKDGNEVGEETEEKTTVTYTDNQYAAFARIIVNKTGTVLPSTGGIGTTIFYVVGGILVAGAAILLITKKRMSARN